MQSNAEWLGKEQNATAIIYHSIWWGICARHLVLWMNGKKQRALCPINITTTNRVSFIWLHVDVDMTMHNKKKKKYLLVIAGSILIECVRTQKSRNAARKENICYTCSTEAAIEIQIIFKCCVRLAVMLYNALPPSVHWNLCTRLLAIRCRRTMSMPGCNLQAKIGNTFALIVQAAIQQPTKLWNEYMPLVHT